MCITAFSQGKLGNCPSMGKGDSLAYPGAYIKMIDLIDHIAKPASKVNQ